MQEITAIEAKERAPGIGPSPAAVASKGTVLSKDGTPIAFTRVGDGPPVILVDGALCYRAMGESGQLAALLAPYFTVLTYDRRGRGGSGDTVPYAVEREIEDIAALLSEAGGAAFLWGMPRAQFLRLRQQIASVGSRSWRCTRHHSSWTTAVPQQSAIGPGSPRRLRQIGAARRSSSF